VLEPGLLEVLVAPDSRQPLHLVDERTLYDPAGRRAYRIDDGIPVLLAGEARPVDDAEHAALTARIAAAAQHSPARRGPAQEGPGA
jgi:uncharacterized protein YbaR (Trm112 family)